MLSLLGLRARLLTASGIAAALVAAIWALSQGELAAAALLILAALVWVTVSGTWAVANAVHSNLQAQAKVRERRRARRASRRAPAVRQDLKDVRMTLDKLVGDVTQIASSGQVGAPAKAGLPGFSALERRYEDVLRQPTSVPTSQLLAVLELLSKRATLEGADDAAVRDMLADIRGALHAQALKVDELAAAVERLGSSLTTQ